MLTAAALFVMMWLTLLDVASRKFGSQSIPGAVEITEILMVAVIFAALPLVSLRHEHVKLDVIYQLLSGRRKRMQQMLVHLVSASVYLLLAYLMTQRGLRFAEYGDTTSYLKLPVAPVAFSMAACLAITAAVHVLLIFLPDYGKNNLEATVS